MEIPQPGDIVMTQLCEGGPLRVATVQGQPHQAGGDTWLSVRFWIQDDPAIHYGSIMAVRLSKLLWLVERAQA